MSSRLTVSLGAIVENYRSLQAAARGRHAQTDVAAVVKADGYGMGAARVAGALAAAGCVEFFVATAAEGITLRRTLPDVTIYVLEGPAHDGPAEFLTHKLTPVLNSARQADRWAACDAPVAIHIDTGMQRLGMSAAEAARLLADKHFTCCLLMTHLARADEPEHLFNNDQISVFLRDYERLAEAHPAAVPTRLSICNSAGIMAALPSSLREPASDLAKQVSYVERAGVALYGGNPFSDRNNPMQPVVSLSARVLQVREVMAGQPVGYGGSFVARDSMQVATVACGYADGVPRLLSNCGSVWLKGRRCPIIGRVSMDMLHADVSELSGVDDSCWAEVLGVHVSVDEIAAQARTISYEVLTGLRARGELVYTDDLLR